MANEAHVKRLKQGVSEWNAWREKNRNVLADLGGAKLIGATLIDANLNSAYLTGADLWRADLTQANLMGANLSGANLSGADLTNAKLIGAYLNGASLTVANLCGADLSGATLIDALLGSANLTGAKLIGAYLNGADLSGAYLNSAYLNGADLTDAVLHWTALGYADLTNVIGLETCVHRGPSIVDHATLQKSGPLPLSFLRGVGLPNEFITYLPSLFNQAIEYYSCFISYSTKDQDFAARIHADLQDKGVRCWFAPHDMPIGGKILDTIDEAIRLRDKVLLILSEHSIKSGWVGDEVSKAFAEERKRGQLVLFRSALTTR